MACAPFVERSRCPGAGLGKLRKSLLWSLSYPPGAKLTHCSVGPVASAMGARYTWGSFPPKTTPKVSIAADAIASRLAVAAPRV
jgi:hypothetical protein